MSNSTFPQSEQVLAAPPAPDGQVSKQRERIFASESALTQSEHVPVDSPIPDGQERRVRTRSITLSACALLAVLLIALAVLSSLAMRELNVVVVQQNNANGMQALSSSSSALDVGLRQTEVPHIGALLGMTSSQALQAIGHGATVVDEEKLQDAVAPGLHSLSIALTTENAAEGQSAPRVVLGVDDADRVRSAQYSVALESLGYSSELSFRQAIVLLHVLEALLEDAGITVEGAPVELEQDRSAYSSYLSDGTTVVREFAEFEGEGSAGELPVRWTASLDYDYSKALETSNLADAVHIISISVES